MSAGALCSCADSRHVTEPDGSRRCRRYSADQDNGGLCVWCVDHRPARVPINGHVTIPGRPWDGYGWTIPWSIHERAWQGYAKDYPSSAREQDAYRIATRGGFGPGELTMWAPGWLDAALPPAGWTGPAPVEVKQ